MRRTQVIVTGVILVSLSVALVRAQAGSPAGALARPPNIVLVLTDDLDLELGSIATMSNLQTLVVREGTTFGSFLVPLSLCCPSRTTILRGQLPHNHGVLTNTEPLGGFSRALGTRLEDATLATVLHDAGYRTVLLGKYLNGYPGPASPTYVPPGWDEWYSPVAGNPYSEYTYTLNENGTLKSFGKGVQDYLTDVIRARAESFVERTAPTGQPFFVYFATYAPHSPATPAPRHAGLFAGVQAPRPPSFDEVDVSDKPAWVRSRPPLTMGETQGIDAAYRLRLQSLQAVDQAIAGLIATLEATGQLDNTYVIFTSDNGFHMGEHRLPSGKYTPYETDIRVPMVVRGPGVPAGVVRDELAGNLDFVATFAELAGLNAPIFTDGRSLVPLLKAGPAPDDWRRSFLLEEFASGVATQTTGAEAADPLSPVGVLEPGDAADLDGTSASIPSYLGFRTATYAYWEYATGERELYLLQSDPFELESKASLAGQSVSRALSGYLATLKTCARDACRSAEAVAPPALLAVELSVTPAIPTEAAAVTLTATASGSPPYEVTWDIEGRLLTGWEVAVRLSPGQHTVVARVRDAIGAEVTVRREVKVSGQPRRHL